MSGEVGVRERELPRRRDHRRVRLGPKSISSHPPAPCHLLFLYHFLPQVAGPGEPAGMAGEAIVPSRGRGGASRPRLRLHVDVVAFALRLNLAGRRAWVEPHAGHTLG